MKLDNNVIDPKFFNQVAQNAHMLLGVSVGLIGLLYAPKYIWCVLGVYMIVTAVKEFWYDQHYENAETRGSNLNDWLHYQVGIGWSLSLYCGAHYSPWAYLFVVLFTAAGFFPWLSTVGNNGG